jgi:hypothetical protein
MMQRRNGKMRQLEIRRMKASGELVELQESAGPILMLEGCGVQKFHKRTD